MAQLIVRNVENAIKARLQRLAKKHGRSMEEEVREILRNAAKEQVDVGGPGLGTEISTLFSGIGLTSEIPELRGHEIKPTSFEP
jgi:antitoxin FitA